MTGGIYKVSLAFQFSNVFEDEKQALDAMIEELTRMREAEEELPEAEFELIEETHEEYTTEEEEVEELDFDQAS